MCNTISATSHVTLLVPLTKNYRVVHTTLVVLLYNKSPVFRTELPACGICLVEHRVLRNGGVERGNSCFARKINEDQQDTVSNPKR